MGWVCLNTAGERWVRANRYFLLVCIVRLERNGSVQSLRIGVGPLTVTLPRSSSSFLKSMSPDLRVRIDFLKKCFWRDRIMGITDMRTAQRQIALKYLSPTVDV